MSKQAEQVNVDEPRESPSRMTLGTLHRGGQSPIVSHLNRSNYRQSEGSILGHESEINVLHPGSQKGLYKQESP